MNHMMDGRMKVVGPAAEEHTASAVPHHLAVYLKMGSRVQLFWARAACDGMMMLSQIPTAMNITGPSPKAMAPMNPMMSVHDQNS